jgi:hypothetical protein
MKLTYSNWHKELVHDDNIQTELNTITDGQLEFNNRPFVKHRAEVPEREDYRSGSGGSNYRKNFGQRNNSGGGGGNGRDNRSGGRDNRGGSRDNRSGSDSRNNNRNFKKRY